MTTPTMKLAIALPFSGRFVPPEWAVALANLQFPMNCTYARVNIKGYPRGTARTALVKTARHMGAEYILFLDDDTAPPYDTVIKLIATLDQHPDVAACGGIYTSRGTSINEPMVFLGQGLGPFWRWRFDEVFPCWALGTGCLMIRLSIFDTLPEPWFVDVTHQGEATEDLYHTQREATIGFQMTDDIFFAKKLAEAGHRMLAHGGVLPVHYDPDGAPHVLDYDSFPLRNTDRTKLWYVPIAPPRTPPEQITEGDLPPGWLTPEEADFLTAQARGKRVLELGAYKGRSTVCLARVAEQVVSVDRHVGDQATGAADTLPAFLRATEPFQNVVPVLADFRAVETLFGPGSFDVVYVDGSHDAQAVERDLAFARRVGTTVLAHDWGAFEVCAGARAAGMTATTIVGSLAKLESVPVAV